MKALWGIIGLYAVFCFWAPVFWLWDHLTTYYGWDYFMFERLPWPEKMICVVAAMMSLVTMFAVLMNLKDPYFIKNENE